MKKILAVVICLLLVILISAVVLVRLRYGGGTTDFPDQTSTPFFDANVLETVADLMTPPGNLAVSSEGRLFFSFHPESRPDIRVAEWKDGKAVPYPNPDYQGRGKQDLYFDSVLSVRIDARNRLWVLDLANHGIGQPRLLAFDLATDTLVHRYDFPGEYAGFGSHLNDFQIDPAAEIIYIADASIMAKKPAILVYDISARKCRRLLENHPSVVPEPYIPVVQGRVMNIFGLFAVRPGVDSIALDKSGRWLYFAPVTSRYMSRIGTADLLDAALSTEGLSRKVETFALKTMSDGLTMDIQDNIYITDIENSAIVRLTPGGKLETLVKDARLRWPDGLGFGPDGWLYVTCSALHQVIGRTPGHINSHAPYQIYRFRPGMDGVPGQ